MEKNKDLEMDENQTPQAPIQDMPDQNVPFYLQPNSDVPPNLQTQSGMPPSVVPVGASQVVMPKAAPAPQPAVVPQVDTTQYAVPVKPTAPPSVLGPSEVQKLGQQITGTYGAQQQANTAIANAAAQKNALDQISHAELEDQFKAQQEKQQKTQEEFDTAYKQRVSHLDDISKQLNAQDFTEPKLDNKRLWNSASTGQKVLAGIALGLGAVGGALTGKSNMAMDVINKAIDKDIEAQKFDIQQDVEGKKLKSQNLRDQGNIQQTMLSDLRSKFGSDLQAATALRAIMYDKTQQQLARNANGLEGTVAKQNAINFNQQLEREKIGAMMQLKAQVATQTALSKMGSGSGEQLTPAQEAMLPKEYREAYVSQRERSVPGFIGTTNRKEDAQKFSEFAGGVKNAIVSLNDAIDFAGKYNSASPEDRAVMETKVKMLIPGMKDALKLTRLSDADIKLIEDINGNPNKVFSMKSWQTARLKELERKAREQLSLEAKSVGLRPIEEAAASKTRPRGQ